MLSEPSRPIMRPSPVTVLLDSTHAPVPLSGSSGPNSVVSVSAAAKCGRSTVAVVSRTTMKIPIVAIIAGSVRRMMSRTAIPTATANMPAAIGTTPWKSYSDRTDRR